MENNNSLPENIELFVKNATPNILSSIIIVIIALLIVLITNRIANKIKNAEGIMHSESGSKMVVIIERIIKVIVILVALFLVLEVNGVSISALVASLGLIGAVATLAAQDVMKDAINGLYISGEKMYAPGDFIKYHDVEGLVLDFSLRSTKIQLIPSKSIMFISNRNISEIIVLSNRNRVAVSMPYELPVVKAEEIMTEVIKEMEKDERVESVEYTGVRGLGESAINYEVFFMCSPDVRHDVSRSLWRIFVLELNKNRLSVPYNKLEVINISRETPT